MNAKRQYIVDENQNPIAVIVPYHEWLQIESVLSQSENEKPVDIKKYAGSIQLTMDPLEFQKNIRNEW